MSYALDEHLPFFPLQDFYSFLANHTGMDISIDNLWKVADTVYVEVLVFNHTCQVSLFRRETPSF